MKLTKEQIEFLDKVCMNKGEWKLNADGEVDVVGGVEVSNMNLTEIPVKFGKVTGFFDCSNNKLTTLKNCPDFVEGSFWCEKNKLTDYFKNIKEEDFKYWGSVQWSTLLKEYPFLINTMKPLFGDNNVDGLRHFLDTFPQTKLYYKD
jgi:hypothetical protein